MKYTQKRMIIIILILAFTTRISYADTQEDVNILLLLDHQFGVSYEFIREIFEEYGWKITTTSIDKELLPCTYGTENITVDLVVEQLGDISSEYDCLSIMPGSVHTTLVESTAVLDMIKEANNKGMLITSWCRAISVLIEADIIQGKNVTGYAIFKDECEEKGATFFLESPPIRDGNIITAVRSRYYRNETCELIKDTIYEFIENQTSVSDVSGGNLLIVLSTMILCVTIKLKKNLKLKEKYK